MGWVGLGWVGLGWVGLGWVGSYRSGRVGSGRVGSGWVGSGQVGSGYVGSVWVGLGYILGFATDLRFKIFLFNKPVRPSIMFVGKAGGYLSGAPFMCFVPVALNINTRLGWRGTPKQTLLAYYERS
jgi:hypothetical protein